MEGFCIRFINYLRKLDEKLEEKELEKRVFSVVDIIGEMFNYIFFLVVK